MSSAERAFRSRLAQIVSGRGLIRGTLQERWHVCGKPTCHCAKGAKHRAVYLVLSRPGGARQLYVPAAWEQRVRQWVANQRTLRELLEAVSEVYWQKLRRRQD